MGAIMYVCRIDGGVVEKLLSREKAAYEYFEECYPAGGSKYDNKGDAQHWIDLDKAWFAIHSLLTGGREDTALPAGALLGGAPTTAGGQNSEDWLVLTVEQTANFAAYLAAMPDDVVKLSPRFAAVVPETYVAAHFRNLKRFVAIAAAKATV